MVNGFVEMPSNMGGIITIPFNEPFQPLRLLVHSQPLRLRVQVIR
jgi:hypothetical protein